MVIKSKAWLGPAALLMGFCLAGAFVFQFRQPRTHRPEEKRMKRPPSKAPAGIEAQFLSFPAKGVQKITLYDTLERKVLKELSGPDMDKEHQIHFSPDNKRLAVLGFRIQGRQSQFYALILSLWDVNSGAFLQEKQVAAFEWTNNHLLPDHGMAWAENAGKMAIWLGGAFYLLQADSLELLGKIPVPIEGPIVHSPFRLLSMVFSPDGTTLYTRDSSSRLIAWDVERKCKRASWGLSSPPFISNIAVDPANTWLLGTGNGSVLIWDAKTFQPVVRFGYKALPMPSEDQLWSHDLEEDTQLATFLEWNKKTSGALLTAQRQMIGSRRLSDGLSSNDGRYILKRGQSDMDFQAFEFIDAKENRMLWISRSLPGDHCSLSPTGKLLAFFGSLAPPAPIPEMGWVEIQHTGFPKLRWKAHQYAITSVNTSKDAHWLVTVCEDWTVRLWDSQTGKLHCQLAGKSYNPHKPVISPDNRYLALLSGDRGHSLQLWDRQTGNLLRRFQQKEANSPLFHPTKPWLRLDRSFVDLSSGLNRTSLPERYYGDQNFSPFSPDGVWFAYLNGNIACIHDGYTLAPVIELKVPDIYGELAFSSDGQTLWWIHWTADPPAVRGEGLVWNTKHWKARPWSIKDKQISAPRDLVKHCPHANQYWKQNQERLCWISQDGKVKIRCGSYDTRQ